MLEVLANSLYKYIDVAAQTVRDVGVNVGVTDQILALLAQEPRLSAKDVASLLNKTTRTIERHIKSLREQGRIQRVGSDKAGHWQIIERPL
jgi:ATP-dependent DNA helicase RecG